MSSSVRHRVGLPALALFKRDFLSQLRHMRSLCLVVAVLGLCTLFVEVAWPRSGVNLRDAAAAARELFSSFGLMHLAVAAIVPPGVAALAFASERRQDTLDQLRLSLVSTPGLILAKLTASVGVVVLLFVATLPTLGVQMLLVGVASEEVFCLMALVLTTAFLSASVGILCAALFRRSLMALIASYIGAAFALGGWFVLIVLALSVLRGMMGERLFATVVEGMMGPYILWRVYTVLDFVAGIPFLPYLFVWQTGPLNLESYAVAAAGYHVLLGLFCLFWAFRILRRPEKPLPIPKERPIDDPAVLWKRRHRFPYYLFDPLRRRDPIGDSANPVLVRELRHGLGVRRHMFVFIGLTATLLGLWWMLPRSMWFDFEGHLQRSMIGATLLSAVVVQVMVANVMTKEREQGDLDMLRMTLLSPYEILIGKIASGLIALSPFLLAVLVSTIPLLIMAQMADQNCVLMLLYGIALLLCCAWLSFCIAFTTSVHAKTTLHSLVWGFLLNTMVYGAPLLLTIVFSSINWYFRLPEVVDWQRKLIELSPLAAYYGIHSGNAPQYLSYIRLNPKDNLLTSLPIVVVAGFVLLAVAYQRLRALEEPDEE